VPSDRFELPDYARWSAHLIPCCWPDAAGRCGCGRGHLGKDAGKAALVSWKRLVKDPPPPEQVTTWRRRYTAANWAVLLEPGCVLVIDLDGELARGEAIGLGLPAGIVAHHRKKERRQPLLLRGPADRPGRADDQARPLPQH
jgi:Bifunctional DNA primase/polymerase, N-terminal